MLVMKCYGTGLKPSDFMFVIFASFSRSEIISLERLSLLVLFYHQILDLDYLSTRFLSVSTGFVFLFKTDLLQASLI